MGRLYENCFNDKKLQFRAPIIEGQGEKLGQHFRSELTKKKRCIIYSDGKSLLSKGKCSFWINLEKSLPAVYV